MAVVAGGAEAVDRIDVLGCAISLVRLPEITGMARGEAIHEIVAQRLGDHRCRRNRVTARIAIDDRFMLAAELRTGQAGDEHPRRREAQPLEGSLHGENRRAPDVVAIDLAHARGSYGDGERAFANLVGEPGALQRRQHFRVVQAANRLRAHRKDDGRGNHWSRQWAAADFVDSSNGDPPLAPERDFALERRTAVSHVSDCSAVSAPAAPAPVPAPGTDAAVRPRFSRMLAAFPYPTSSTRRPDVSTSRCRVHATRDPAAVRASAVRLAPPAMSRSCRGRHSTILPGRRDRDSWAAAYSWAARAIPRSANRSTLIRDRPTHPVTAAPPHQSRTMLPAHRPTTRNPRSI